jgi:tyrosine-protein kinase Etk/Wzc
METAYSKTSAQVEMGRAEIKKLDEKLKDVSRQGVRIGGGDEGAQWLFPAVEKVPALAMEQMDLERRLRLQVELYKLLVTQREMARIDEAKERSTMQVVAAATAPDWRVGMGVGLKLALGLVAGFAIGTALTGVLEQVLTGFRSGPGAGG